MSAIALRALTPNDTNALIAFHDRCSDRTHYLRFFAAKKHLSEQEAEYFCDVDQHERGAFAAIQPEHPEIIHGVGRWAQVDGDHVDVAFTVEDAYQGQGIGRRLFAAVTNAVKMLGYKFLVGDVLAENKSMRHINATCGYPLTEHNAGYGDVEFEIQLGGE